MRKLELSELSVKSFKTKPDEIRGMGTWVCTEDACTRLGLCPSKFCQTLDAGCESVEYCPTGNLPCPEAP